MALLNHECAMSQLLTYEVCEPEHCILEPAQHANEFMSHQYRRSCSFGMGRREERSKYLLA